VANKLFPDWLCHDAKSIAGASSIQILTKLSQYDNPHNLVISEPEKITFNGHKYYLYKVSQQYLEYMCYKLNITNSDDTLFLYKMLPSTPFMLSTVEPHCEPEVVVLDDDVILDCNGITLTIKTTLSTRYIPLNFIKIEDGEIRVYMDDQISMIIRCSSNVLDNIGEP